MLGRRQEGGGANSGGPLRGGRQTLTSSLDFSVLAFVRKEFLEDLCKEKDVMKTAALAATGTAGLDVCVLVNCCATVADNASTPHDQPCSCLHTQRELLPFSLSPQAEPPVYFLTPRLFLLILPPPSSVIGAVCPRSPFPYPLSHPPSPLPTPLLLAPPLHPLGQTWCLPSLEHPTRLFRNLHAPVPLL